MTDDQLIERFLDGDVQAFNTLVWRWQQPIYNFVLRYTSRHDDASEITQKTFIKVHKSLSRLKDKRKFSTWIYQIALNTCRDEAKRRRNHAVYSLDGMRENGWFDLPDDGTTGGQKVESPEKALQRSELRDLLERALAQIPEEQKAIVVMKEYQGLKFAEIAEVLGLSVNTVKSRMYYGLHALKKILHQWNIDKEAIHYEL